MVNFVRSPLAYQGSKFKLLESLQKEAGDFRRLHDVFGGSGTVSLNLKGSGKTIYNDWDPAAFSILTCLKEHKSPRTIITKLDKIIAKHGLHRKAEDEYYAFRDWYNRNRHPFNLWVLSKHSFSSLMRFNDSGEFNLPFGFRGPEKSEQRDRWINDFWHRLQSVELHNLSYLQYVKKFHKRASEFDLFYFDPPYLASGDNVYKGNWTIEDEKRFLSMLDYLDNMGLRWMLSNVVKHRSFTNKILQRWMKQYRVVYPNFKTSGEGYILNRAATSGPNNTVEVLIKNY